MTTFLADPNAIFLLMTLGLYGLVYEFVSPGTFLPGAAGVICLLLVIFAVDKIPVDYAGVFLMMMGIAAMTAEAFFRTYGALAFAGAACFSIGGMMFIAGVNPWLVGSMTLLSAALLSAGLKLVLRTRRAAVSTGTEGMRGSGGEIVSWSQTAGEVLAAGTVWKARSTDSYILKKGDKVKVIDLDGLCLIVQPDKQ